MASITEQLRRAQVKNKALAKRAKLVDDLERELEEVRGQVELAQQAAADVHTAMGKQDVAHESQLAQINAKLDRVLAAWAEILRTTETMRTAEVYRTRNEAPSASH